MRWTASASGTAVPHDGYGDAAGQRPRLHHHRITDRRGGGHRLLGGTGDGEAHRRQPGLGKVLPRGAFLPVPFFCDAFVGPPLADRPEDTDAFVEALEAAMAKLVDGTRFPEWD